MKWISLLDVQVRLKELLYFIIWLNDLPSMLFKRIHPTKKRGSLYFPLGCFTRSIKNKVKAVFI